MLKKAYVEITNVCNLSCSFCPGTKREARFITAEEFKKTAEALVGHTRFLYFHLMGEPLLHPELPKLLDIADEKGFRVIITTNGTLLSDRSAELLSANALHRVNISLQSFEGSGGRDMGNYISDVCAFAASASEKGIICSLRLWNDGGENSCNPRILALLESCFPPPWEDCTKNLRLAPRVFLEHGDKFDWPDLSADERDVHFCYGLRDQIGILCDGTVVPCCLDHDGSIPLGNIRGQSLSDILASPRARAIYDGFSGRKATEELCRRCGYASRFK
ncbi:MAG: radical SAM protein [Oscillospiraceae bacterium]|nr:radical SAM protein [Oscillospiraceae bacterium]